MHGVGFPSVQNPVTKPVITATGSHIIIIVFILYVSRLDFEATLPVAAKGRDKYRFVPGTTISLRSFNRSHAKCRIELLGFFGKMFSARKKLCYDIRDEI